MLALNKERRAFETTWGHNFMNDTRYTELHFDGEWYNCFVTSHNIDLQVYCSDINAMFLLWCKAVEHAQQRT